MYQALTLKQPENVYIPSELTICCAMEEMGISHHPRHKPNGITGKLTGGVSIPARFTEMQSANMVKGKV